MRKALHRLRFQEDPANRISPDTDSLDELGRHLLTWLAGPSTPPKSLDRYFFPRTAFLQLKQARSPAGYWRYLRRRFHRDLVRLKQRKRWQGVEFLDWRPSPSVWVRPGREHNYIGYHRMRGARLRYRLNGRTSSLVLDTLITWQGRWYVIHLLPLTRK